MLLLLTACAGLNRPPSAEPIPADPVAEPTADAGHDGSNDDGEPAGMTALDEAALGALLANPGAEPLVVNFWATWCGPCVREMGVFRDVAAEHTSVRFALVNVEGTRNEAAVLRFLSNEGGGLPAFNLTSADASGVLSRTVPAWPNLIPVTLVIEPGGAIRTRFDGALDAPALREALAGPGPSGR
ncbi:MAG: thioredoxin domain-containing protein [Pseudomonadota bacterium]|nr:thioredoxin domain-containing protein [Pseudomonadota bacterium]